MRKLIFSLESMTSPTMSKFSAKYKARFLVRDKVDYLKTKLLTITITLTKDDGG